MFTGCPTDYSILGVLSEVNNTGQILQAAFDAFKFPTSDVVQFRALVTPCIPRCDPVRCDVTDYYGRSNNLKSFGKKRKKRSSSESEGEDNELMVAGVIHISDKFELDETGKEQGGSGSSSGVLKKAGGGQAAGNGGSSGRPSNGGEEVWTQYSGDTCLHTASFAIGATIFLFAQCLLIGFWTYLYYKRKRQKEDEVNCSITEAVLQDQFHQRCQRPPVTPQQHLNVVAAASSTDSGLADYDPYFADPFDVPGLGVVSFDEAGVMSTAESVATHRCHQGGLRYVKKKPKKHARRKTSSMEEDMSSSPESSLSSLDPRNL